jgi:glutamine amidotransferase PdxT
MNVIKKLAVLILSLIIISGWAQNTQMGKKIVAGVFNGSGAGDISIIETQEALKIDKGIIPVEISAAEIASGKLKEIDVLIFPGGSGSQQLNNLGKKAALMVQDFVKTEGKGVVGICAGSFLLSSTNSYPSLGLGDVTVVDRDHYDRGKGLIEFNLSAEGLLIFPELESQKLFLQYYDGPVLEAFNKDKSFKELGKYITDIHPKPTSPSGITPGKIFIYNQKVGNGKIFAIGGHPESTPGMRWMLPRMVRWVNSSKMVSYDTKWIDPGRYTHAILFDTQVSKQEKENWWLLFSDKPEEQIKAMDNLYELKSRPAVRWYVGLLRDTNAEVRAHAATLLAKTEYTAAVKDIEIAITYEKDQMAKDSMLKALELLRL